MSETKTSRTDSAVDHYYYNKGGDVDTIIERSKELERDLTTVTRQRDELMSIAGGLLTCLNVGNIQSGSLIHLDLRKQMIRLRKEIEAEKEGGG